MENENNSESQKRDLLANIAMTLELISESGITDSQVVNIHRDSLNTLQQQVRTNMIKLERASEAWNTIDSDVQQSIFLFKHNEKEELKRIERANKPPSWFDRTFRGK